MFIRVKSVAKFIINNCFKFLNNIALLFSEVFRTYMLIFKVFIKDGVNSGFMTEASSYPIEKGKGSVPFNANITVGRQ